jgi:L-iditol 2-dehydrogenase
MHAIRQINPKAGEKAVVIGLGTIGLLICMLLQNIGVEIYAVGNKPYQYEMLKKLGIKRRELENGHADCVFECVGRPATISDAIEYAAPSARVVTVGNPASDISLPKDVYWKILRNQLELHGTWNSSFTGKDSDDWHQVLRLLAAERIHPELLISHLLPLEKLDSGLSIMHEKKNLTQRSCVLIRSDGFYRYNLPFEQKNRLPVGSLFACL